ncbi:MAG: hypothetical protein LBQ57_01305 [Spirochaetales bacterium]|nr:hypothetical protein [Spirochaetales bacterium]
MLEDGDIVMRLRGSYDPNTGNWSVSAKSSAIIYTLDGSVDSAGISRSSSATIAVKSAEEWIPYYFPITETAVSVPVWDEVDEGETGGAPSIGHGYWYSKNSGGGYTTSISILVSAWKTTVTGTVISPFGTMPIEQSWSLLELEDKGGNVYELIACYPDYVKTSADVAKAAEAYLDLNDGAIEALTEYPFMGDTPPTGRWVYVESADTTWWGDFSTAEFGKLEVYWGTGGWEKWASRNGVTKANKYVKARMSFNSLNSFDMVNLVQISNTEEPWQSISTFSSLADLKAKASSLVEEHDWNWTEYPPTDLGVYKMTFTR